MAGPFKMKAGKEGPMKKNFGSAFKKTTEPTLPKATSDTTQTSSQASTAYMTNPPKHAITITYPDGFSRSDIISDVDFKKWKAGQKGKKSATVPKSMLEGFKKKKL